MLVVRLQDILQDWRIRNAKTGAAGGLKIDPASAMLQAAGYGRAVEVGWEERWHRLPALWKHVMLW